MEEIRARSDGEIRLELETAYRDLLHLRFRWETRQLANIHDLKKLQKDIARMNTVLTERTLEIR